MNFMFSWQEQYLTRSLRSLVRYCSCHSNIKFISSRRRVIFSISSDAAVDGWVEPQLFICFFSALGFSLFHLAYCKIESSSLFFVGFIVAVKEIYTSVACDIGDMFWTYNLCFLQLADRCFSCTMIRKLFLSLSLRLVPATDTFIMLVMVFSPIGTWLEISVVIMENLYPCSFKYLKSVAVIVCVWLPPFLFFIFLL